MKAGVRSSALAAKREGTSYGVWTAMGASEMAAYKITTIKIWRALDGYSIFRMAFVGG
jgi:hypothetical protein